MPSGGGGSSTQTQTVTEKADPWGAQQPYLKYGFGQAKDLYQSGGPQYYPEQTTVPYSPQTQAGIDMMTGRAMQGSPVSDAFNQQIAQTLGGDYLGSNPYLDRQYDAAARGMGRQFANYVQPGVDAQFTGAGRYGGLNRPQVRADNTQAYMTGLGDLGAQMYGKDYADERGRMMQAGTLAPSAAQMDYNDINALLSAGGMVEDRARQILGDQMGRFTHYQNLPEQNLQRYIAAIQGNYGGASTSNMSGQVPTYGQNPVQGAIGGGLAGWGLSQAFPSVIGGPLGIGVGAGLGLLSSIW